MRKASFTQINELIAQETERQQNTLSLIASENYASAAVRQATASSLTNKYAEGYPGKRYYAGCALIDQIETHAIQAATSLFGAQHANVQPHAGSQANMAAYCAFLKHGDTIMGMNLMAGGHLTHGHHVNFSGRLYKSVSYGVDQQTDLIDYDQIATLAHAHRPAMIIAGSSAYSRIIDFEKFAYIAQEVNALLLADISHIAGLVAAGLHPSPVGHARIITSTTHKTLRGPRGAFILCDQEDAAKIDAAVMPGTQGGPFMNVIAAKAIALQEAMHQDFKTYAAQIIKNAQSMTQTFQERGYKIVSNGTDNHLFVIDLSKSSSDVGSLNGKQAEELLEQIGITSSRSCVPYDTKKPWLGSGLRLGTAAITTRGLKEEQAQLVAELVDETLRYRNDAARLERIAHHVKDLAIAYPIPD